MLQKESIDISFAQGLDTKTDPFRVPVGKFLSLENSIFDKAGMLQKRNGYRQLSTLPNLTTTYLTTFNGNLTAVGTTLQAYSPGTETWQNKGNLQPIDLFTLPVVRSSTNQGYSDCAVASNGLVCVAYSDQNPSNLSTTIYKYAVLDSVTGQYIVNPTQLNRADATYGTPRVFVLGNYFIITFTSSTSGFNLQYIAVPLSDPSMTTSPETLVSSYSPATTVAYDCIVVANNLYFVVNNTSGGQSLKIGYMNSSLIVTAPTTLAGYAGTMFSMAEDVSTGYIYISFYNLSTTSGYVTVINQSLGTILAPTLISSSGTILNLASVAQNGSATIYAEVSNTYGYDSSIHTNYITKTSITQAGSVGSTTVVTRAVGLASKAFLINGIPYFLTVYSSLYQPTYFLINGLNGLVVAKLAYSNAGPYQTTGLPNATVSSNTVYIPYLFKDLLQSVNKTQGAANAAGIYSQTGVKLASFTFELSAISAAEIGSNLNLTGGFISAYDGVTPVEQGFFLWPDSVELASTTGGSMTAQQYFYQVIYEWTDNQGNIFRSAPSIPVTITLTSGTAVTLSIPTLRLTYKTANPVKISIFRWSAAQENYFLVTPVTSPILNDPTVDYITYTDKAADSSILGNEIIYTTGGVLEDVSPPASSNACLFNNRLWLVDAEDRNLLWYSKQVIEATPVEMSDLLTLYVAPSTASQGSTGPITAIAPMDDKLIVFKKDALGYVNGIGPDNTGANNQYSDFTLINSVVGCTLQQSIVFTPSGLMFQSDKGIWLLGRDLSTQYIGAPVESFTGGAKVLSALNIPTTNQVRFTLDSGITLLYDYYYQQWGTFTNIPAVSSTVYQSLHTYVNSLGQVFQETPGLYLDNTKPVLMSLTTGWIALAGIQGYERFYYALLLGTYLSPFALNVQFAYNYNSSPQQSILVTPDNVSTTWGSGSTWGSDPTWGGQNNSGWQGQGNVFEARVFPEQQKCESFQVSITEVFNGSIGTAAGAGLTLSGMSLLAGIKRNARTSRAARSFG